MFSVLLFALAAPPQFTVVNKCPPVVVNKTAEVIPPGHHSHVTTDGRTIVHADSNYGNAAAHAGIEWPWLKVATAGQVVQSAPDPPAFAPSYGLPVRSGNCPGGVCPTPQSTVWRGRFR